MKIRPRNIPKFQTPAGPLNYEFYVPGLIRRNILLGGTSGNNIYFNLDWKGYNNWHSNNIVLKGYNTILNPQSIEWEDYLKKGMDSWNNAGGFDWLYSTNPSYRKHRLHSTGTKAHLDLVINEYDWLNKAIGDSSNYSYYNIPSDAYTADRFENGQLVGRNGVKSDNDFGVQTGNRRPTIHVNTDYTATKNWDNYFSKLGYVGAYEYLDHWIPTKDANKATRKFGPVMNEELRGQIIGKSPNNPPSATVLEGQNKKNNPNEIDPSHKEGGYGFDWNKITTGIKLVLPNLIETGRLVGSLAANNKIYDAKLKGIRPNLVLPYLTHRQVVGDEATKQAYYRRGAEGLTKASLPFTSDADRQMAYMMEAKRINDELLALGDLPDNLEIRRTSDESNLHEWSNTERKTRSAIENIAQLNYANAAKLDLIAQKYAANLSSWDNYWKSLENKLLKKLAEDKALEDEIFALTEQTNIMNDPQLNYARLLLDKVIKANTKKDGTVDYNAVQNSAEYKNFKKEQINAAVRSRQRRLEYNKGFSLFAALGTKITRKVKNDLLYKSAKDVVKHFREMSKMSDNSTQRSRPKRIFKLNSHPGGTRRMQLGGVAPFTVFTPITLGGETSTLVSSGGSSSSKSSKNDDGKEILDLVKSLFKELRGLPIDVNSVYKQMSNFLGRASLFGNEMSTSDIASMYLLSIQLLNNLKHSLDVYSKAEALATSNGALNEYAVTADGLYVVQDSKGEISFAKSWEDVLNGNKNPITNQQLLHLRAYSPNMSFSKGDYLVLNIINNGMGVNKIGAQIKALAGSIGASELKIEGLTQVESGKVKSGLLLLANAPDGYYKSTTYTKSQQDLMKAALAYIRNMLSPSLRAILETHGGTDALIKTFLSSLEDSDYQVSIAPLTGKTASKSSDSESKGGLEMNNALKLLTGAGEGHLETFGIGNNNVFLAIGRQSTIADTSDSEKPFGADFSYTKIYESGIGRILDLDNASFGDVPINKTMKDSIIVDNSRIVSVDLPYTTTRDGRIIPDFKLLNRILEADEEILRQNLNPNKESDINKINQIYANKKLPIKYNSANLLSGNYKKFAVILATAVEDVFLDKNGLETNATLTLVTDDNEKDKYVRLMSEITKDKKYSLSKPGIFSWGDKDIYKGSIFIPITGDILDASLAGGGSKVKTGMSDDYDTMRKAWQVRNYLEVPQVNFGN